MGWRLVSVVVSVVWERAPSGGRGGAWWGAPAGWRGVVLCGVELPGVAVVVGAEFGESLEVDGGGSVGEADPVAVTPR